MISFLAAVLCLVSCRSGQPAPAQMASGNRYARYFQLLPDGVVSVSPYDGGRDTLRLTGPLHKLVCLSTSYIGYLDALGAAETVAGVSGIGYVTQPQVRDRAVDVGYDAALDYERIVALHPDLLVTYTVSSVVPPSVAKLRSLGIPVLVLHEHREDHPLARAEYIRLFGALTGRRSRADSVFAGVADRYEALVQENRRRAGAPVKVLMNMPYGDQWFIPGRGNYISRLVADAGGTVLGAREGDNGSRVVSREEAWTLASEADAWLHPGGCRTRAQLLGSLPLFGRLAWPGGIYNNIRRQTPQGGNDFWESGAACPDRILSDLTRIFTGTATDSTLFYYIRVE